MLTLRFIPAALAGTLLAAHFLRAEQIGLAALCAGASLLLAVRRLWAVRVVQGLLVAGAGVWVETAARLAGARIAADEPWLRLVAILAAVCAITLIAAALLGSRSVRGRYSRDGESVWPSVAAFFVAGGLLSIVCGVVRPPMLLADRFAYGAGWVEVLLLATYAAWLTDRMADPKSASTWRLRLWLGFSVVFFGQFAMGLAGVERFLMTGHLHLPVPALIVAGPIYRGGGLFMPILLAVTLLLIGPAWCSYLCYVGAWDGAAATARTRPIDLPRWRRSVRVGILIAVVGAAFGLRALGVSSVVAGTLAAAFGLAGVAIMVGWSRRTGAMTHCVTWCPVGLIADIAGKVSPFRVRIGDGCDLCGTCATACRYDALHEDDIRRGVPGLSCTLCGDCVARCKARAIGYRFAGLSPENARRLFLALAIALHAVFLGVARI